MGVVKEHDVTDMPYTSYNSFIVYDSQVKWLVFKHQTTNKADTKKTSYGKQHNTTKEKKRKEYLGELLVDLVHALRFKLSLIVINHRIRFIGKLE
jgi:hypothetical protein